MYETTYRENAEGLHSGDTYSFSIFPLTLYVSSCTAGSTGSVTYTLSSGGQSSPTPTPSCTDECTNYNERWCEGNNVMVCIYDSSTKCWKKGLQTTCSSSSNQKCIDGYCKIIAVDDCSFSGKQCVGGDVYECYDNDGDGGKDYVLIDDCDYSTESCENGVCVTNKISRYAKNCYNNNVWWIDNLGNFEEVVEYCKYGCSNGQCKQQDCSPNHYEKRCYNNRPYWYDKCGKINDALPICNYDTEKCEDGECIKIYNDECSSNQIKCINDNQYVECKYRSDLSAYRWDAVSRDCGVGKRCENNKCIVSIKECPYECCDSASGYLTKSCEIGYECIGNRCKKPLKCGDKQCTGNEDCKSCEIDCGSCTKPEIECPYECCLNEKDFHDKFCDKNYICYKNKCQQDIYGLDSDIKTKIIYDDEIVINKLNDLIKDYSKSRFSDNVKKIHEFVSSIPYRYDDENECPSCGDGRPGADYSQTSVETIKEGKGDCEDHAILEQSLIEALYKKTLGSIPKDKTYVLCGCVDINEDGKQDGCHCWNVVKINFADMSSSRETNVEQKSIKKEIILDDVSFEGYNSNPKIVNLERSKINSRKDSLSREASLWNGEVWIELESTWGDDFDTYAMNDYPFTKIWFAANSQTYEYKPDITKLLSGKSNPLAENSRNTGIGVSAEKEECKGLKKFFGICKEENIIKEPKVEQIKTEGVDKDLEEDDLKKIADDLVPSAIENTALLFYAFNEEVKKTEEKEKQPRDCPFECCLGLEDSKISMGRARIVAEPILYKERGCSKGVCKPYLPDEKRSVWSWIKSIFIEGEHTYEFRCEE